MQLVIAYCKIQSRENIIKEKDENMEYLKKRKTRNNSYTHFMQ